MGIRETINTFIRELSIRYGRDLPPLNSNNVCTMRYKDEFTFIIEAPDAGSEVYFYSPLIEKTDENDERLQQKLLEENFFFGSGTEAALSLDEQTGDVVFCQICAKKDLNTDTLEQKIENFLSEADKKRTILMEWMQRSEVQNPIDNNAALDKARMCPTAPWTA